MCLALGPQRNDAGEARTRGPSVSSQTLYLCAPIACWVIVLMSPATFFSLERKKLMGLLLYILNWHTCSSEQITTKQWRQMSCDMRFPTRWYVRPAKPQISLRIGAV